jgi:hypothetical protein
MPRAEIATTQAKYTLEQLHAELGGKILDNKKEAARLAQAMKHVEAVLRMLDPTYNVRPIAVRRRKPNPWFKRGTVFRCALDALRAAGKPLTVRELALAMLAAKGVTDAPPKAVRDLFGAVQSSLRNHKDGIVIENVETHPAQWSIRGQASFGADRMD